MPKAAPFFRQALPLDAETWQRGRGWALWKAMIVLAAERERDARLSEWSRRTIRNVVDDHLSIGPKSESIFGKHDVWIQKVRASFVRPKGRTAL